MIAVMCTQGTLKFQEIRDECPTNKWFPILTYVINGEQVLLLFSDQKVAKQFIKRNLPKDWLHGAIELTDDDEKMLRERFKVREMNYPNLMKDLPGIEWKEEVLELDERPNFHVSRL
jgi:hypothetical protein